MKQLLRAITNMIRELKVAVIRSLPRSWEHMIVNMTHNDNIRTFEDIAQHFELEDERLGAAKASESGSKQKRGGGIKNQGGVDFAQKKGARGKKSIFIRYPNHSKGYVFIGFIDKQSDEGITKIESLGVDFFEEDFPSRGEWNLRLGSVLSRLGFTPGFSDAYWGDDLDERKSTSGNLAPTLAAGLVEIKSKEVKKKIAAFLAVLSPTQTVIATHIATQIALATSSRPSSKKKWCDIHKWGYHSNKEFSSLDTPRDTSSIDTPASSVVLFPDTSALPPRPALDNPIGPLAPGPDSPSTSASGSAPPSPPPAPQSEVDELEELDKEKDKYFASKTREMKEFSTQVEKFGGECRRSVEELRNLVMELRSSFMELQGKSGCSNNSEIATAEMRKSELLAIKEKIERSLASNYYLRTQLQKQLRSILISQNQDGQRLLKQLFETISLVGGWVTLYGVNRLEREDIRVPKRKWDMSIIEQSVMMDYKHCRHSLPFTVASAILCIAQLPICAILLRQLEL
ncbi:hypothetical protein RJ640_007420 [Escallonia rubra]|uniref:Uncharacterized protein n=1 Tax=Escallonia rubra TaxID=112253 RepID=A0AA88UU93_9ASTE|nr:hypothetical protein RJ640_007420 [Escallonia rubra]